MTTYEKYDSLLRVFGIPGGEDEVSGKVRLVLRRLLASRAIRLADLQMARDIAERAEVKAPEVYLFLAAIFVSSGKGNAYMRDSTVADLLVAGGYLDEPTKLGFSETNEGYSATVRDICQSLTKAEWKTALEHDVLERENDLWYFQRDWNAVRYLSDALRGLAVAKEIGEISAGQLEQAAQFGFQLNPAQKEALKAAATQRFTVITGGPGTGKTTTVCAILRALLSQNPTWTEKDIALAAPTGRAAQRMQEAILAQCEGLPENEAIVKLAPKFEGTTVHRLLGGYAPNWKHNEKLKLEQKVVIVDETSMVDLYLMEALLKALPDETRLILLGDADQLPSVGAGAVLGDLTKFGMDSGVVKKLLTCERAKGEIYEASQTINSSDEKTESAEKLIVGWKEGKDKKTITVEALPCSGTIGEGKSEFRWLVPSHDVKKADILAFYEMWMKGSMLAELAGKFPKDDIAFSGKMKDGEKKSCAAELFRELNRLRILTLVREGWYGVKEANAHLLKVAKSAAREPYADYLSLVGVPIMVTKNTSERKLFNGDVGVTVKGPNGMVVLFLRGEKTIACPVALLPEHELAYAMTVHKSQGSEFENVMVVLPDDQNHPLLNRQIVYTGITRAKKRAVIVGTEEALKVALTRKLERDTGISI